MKKSGSSGQYRPNYECLYKSHSVCLHPEKYLGDCDKTNCPIHGFSERSRDYRDMKDAAREELDRMVGRTNRESGGTNGN